MMDRHAGTPQESQAVVRTLSCVLQKLVDVNRKLDTSGTQVITKFHASRPPSISVRDYLERINKYASCSTECFVLALVYIDRLIQHSNFALTSLNVHRVIITSVMLAAKFFDDQYFNNLYYAKVGGVPCKEINSLEVEFLFLINFSLHVTEEQYYRYFTELANHAVSSACPCCAGTRVPHGPCSSPFKAEQSMMVMTQQTPPPPSPASLIPQHHQHQPQLQQVEMQAPMEVQGPPPPPPPPQQQARFTYFHTTAGPFVEGARMPVNPPVMMGPTSNGNNHAHHLHKQQQQQHHHHTHHVAHRPPSTMAAANTGGHGTTTTSTGQLSVAGGTLSAPRAAPANPSAMVSMAEMVAGNWDRAPGRHHHLAAAITGGSVGGRVKLPVDQAMLVGMGVGAYEYKQTSYEYDYPPMMVPTIHQRSAKSAATPGHVATGGPAMLYSHHQPPFGTMMGMPLLHTGV